MYNKSLISRNLEQALLTMDQEMAEDIIFDSIKMEPPIVTAGELITSTLTRIGDAWEEGSLSLSQVYMSGIICEKIIDKILPPKSPDRKSQPKMAIGVFEDFHFLGKRIVYSTLRASGFELLDLGGGLSLESIVSKVREENIEILLISVLMLPSALRIKKLKEKLADTNVKIIVGGAPFRFDENLWEEVGADYCGKDSSDALEIVKRIVEGNQ
jgi:methanogenic corrinoid protein MtbC1